METLRCTNCGSNKITIINEHICECQSCNSQIIMPKQQNTETIDLLNMAYIFRSRYDYDLAIETYKMVLAKDEDELSAYEGLLLAKYGIEYVYDQRTNRHIPTCHRANFKSIYEDSEYQKYLLKSNIEQRQIFEQKAREIDNLQKQIKRQIENEKDYDVFISYKATDSNGNPTIDSEIARDIYDELKARKLNVFFSEVELRNRLAANYEPIIFHALQTSKIFILVGTKKEHVESVWVKNEWSRFFERMEDSQDTVTKHNYIPVFKNMNPYDMPKGNLLQGVDASQPGWIKRLGDGIDQLLGRNEKDHSDKDLNQLKQELENKLKTQVEEIRKTSQSANISKYTSNIENYLKRVKLYIEENNINEAKNYIKKILDEDVENAEAWFLSELINLGLKKEEDLINYDERIISQDKEMIYAIKYAKEEQKARYQKYVNTQKINYDNKVKLDRENLLKAKIPEYTNAFVSGLRRKDVDGLNLAVTMSKNMEDLNVVNFVSLFYKSFPSEKFIRYYNEYKDLKNTFEFKPVYIGSETEEQKIERRKVEERERRRRERIYELESLLPFRNDIKEKYFLEICKFYNSRQIKAPKEILNATHDYFIYGINEENNLFNLYQNGISEGEKEYLLSQAKCLKEEGLKKLEKQKLESLKIDKKRIKKQNIIIFIKILHYACTIFPVLVISNLLINHWYYDKVQNIYSIMKSFEKYDLILGIVFVIYLIISAVNIIFYIIKINNLEKNNKDLEDEIKYLKNGYGNSKEIEINEKKKSKNASLQLVNFFQLILFIAGIIIFFIYLINNV